MEYRDAYLVLLIKLMKNRRQCMHSYRHVIRLTRAEDVDVTEQRDFRASCTLRPRASTSPQATPFLLLYYYCPILLYATPPPLLPARPVTDIDLAWQNPKNNSKTTYLPGNKLDLHHPQHRPTRPTPSWPNTASSSWIPTRISSSNSRSYAYLKNSSRRISKPPSDQ
jgi:hypothetical protein